MSTDLDAPEHRLCSEAIADRDAVIKETARLYSMQYANLKLTAERAEKAESELLDLRTIVAYARDWRKARDEESGEATAAQDLVKVLDVYDAQRSVQPR